MSWLPFDVALPALALAPDELVSLLERRGVEIETGPSRMVG